MGPSEVQVVRTAFRSEEPQRALLSHSGREIDTADSIRVEFVKLSRKRLSYRVLDPRIEGWIVKGGWIYGPSRDGSN